MLEKQCEFCQITFGKPSSCSVSDWNKRRFCSYACKSANQVGQPTWNKGLTLPKTAALHPCRICGQPTRYPLSTARLDGIASCDRAECVAESRRIKNARISETARTRYASGERSKVYGNWQRVPKISAEESALDPWFTDMEWIAQYRFLTGVHTNTLPRMFRLDFADPTRCLYVEIDGTSHRHKINADKRRDDMMSERGWCGLRVSSSIVRSDIDAAKHLIASWIEAHNHL